MNALALTGLVAGYDGADVLHGLDLHVGAGEVVALLGVNGAGKTTTVRTVTGLLATRSGSVHVVGTDVTAMPTHQRARAGLAVVTDDRPLFRVMTVAENLRLGARRVETELDLESWFPQLVPLLGRAAGLLSGGEQQTVAIARALAGQPRALIVDELSAGLAPAAAASVVSALRRAADEWGTGVLIAEQATELALGAADRAVVLSNGRVVIEGRAADLARRPDILAATYLGGRGNFSQD